LEVPIGPFGVEGFGGKKVGFFKVKGFQGKKGLILGEHFG